MRFAIAMIALCGTVAADAATIDLDTPGVLDQLQRSKPALHARVMTLVSAAQSTPCTTETFRVVQAKVAARDIDCSMLIRTSLPPKQRVTFALDGATYTTVVALRYTSSIVR